ncbi:MAG: LysM peptidoglycan-binding domain-containing M23 family metallopeptidase [Oligoflexales bacterium]
MFLLITGCLSDKGEPLWEIEVERGDTVKKIALQYEVSVRDILRLNQFQSPSFLPIGKVIVVPRKTFSDHQTKMPIWPVLGVMTSDFGKRGSSHHDGVDIAAERGRRIVASLEGTVTFSGYKRGYGKTVIVDHGGAQSLYAHCDKIDVEKGRFVETGQVIGRVGSTGRSTGPHVHFEWRMPSGKPIHPKYAVKGRLKKNR